MMNLIQEFFFLDFVQASVLALVSVCLLTIIRDYCPTRNQWVWLSLLIHGGLLAYFANNCAPLNGITEPSRSAIHDVVCGNTGGYKISEWGTVERVITLLLCFGAVGINVIPKYRKRDLAERHVARIRQSERAGAMSNPLLFHIITGILTVLGSGMAAQYGRFTDALLVALVLFDIGHQLSIYRLIPNHDGIWTLRCGNVNLAIVKFIACLRLFEDPQAKIDLVFMYSAGFMFTRVFNFAFGFAHVMWLPKEAWMHEYWYSLGLSGAQFWVMFRTASFSMPAFWFSCIVTSVLYYHKLWDVAHRNYLTAINCALFVLSFYATGYTTQVGLCVAYYYLAGFRLPHYHRHRCPRKWRPMVEVETVTRASSFVSRASSFASQLAPQTSFAELEDDAPATEAAEVTPAEDELPSSSPDLLIYASEGQVKSPLDNLDDSFMTAFRDLAEASREERLSMLNARSSEGVESDRGEATPDVSPNATPGNRSVLRRGEDTAVAGTSGYPSDAATAQNSPRSFGTSTVTKGGPNSPENLLSVPLLGSLATKGGPKTAGALSILPTTTSEGGEASDTEEDDFDRDFAKAKKADLLLYPRLVAAADARDLSTLGREVSDEGQREWSPSTPRISNELAF